MGVETAVAIGGALLSAGTAIYQGQQESKAANAQAKAAEAEGEFQRKQAEADARAEKDAAEIRADTIRKAGREQRAKARAAAAASGMDVGLGTAMDIQSEVTSGAEYDAQMSIFGGLDAFKRGNQAGQALQIRGQNEAIALKNEGAAAKQAGFISAASSVANAGMSAYGSKSAKDSASAANDYHNHVGANAKGGGARRKY